MLERRNGEEDEAATPARSIARANARGEQSRQTILDLAERHFGALGYRGVSTNAIVAEPRISKRLKLVWIGGNEYADLATPPPGAFQAEYNLTQDLAAAQVIFNESDIELWQVPRSTYRQMLIGRAELEEVARASAIGAWLKAQLDGLIANIARLVPQAKISPGETYMLGDSPLVTLTALQSFFQPDPDSSTSQIRPTARLNDDGSCSPTTNGRPCRIYTRIDTRLTFGDMAAKMRMAGGRQRGG